MDVLHMVETHCKICRSGPQIDCSNMELCPLALSRFKEVVISPYEFAKMHKVKYVLPTIVPQQPPPTNPAGQFSLF
jgi:hypothetical protein